MFKTELEEYEIILEVLQILRIKTENELIINVSEKNFNKIDTILKTQSMLDEWIDEVQNKIIDIKLTNSNEDWYDEGLGF